MVLCVLVLMLRGNETISGLIGCWATGRIAGCARALATVFVIRAATLADNFFPPPPPPPDAFVAFLAVAGFTPPVALETVVVVPAPSEASVDGRLRIAAADFTTVPLGVCGN